MAALLGAVIRMARLAVEDVLGVFDAFNEQAAALAASHAPAARPAAAHAAFAALDQARDAGASQEAVCGFLTELKLELACALAGSGTDT